MPSVRPDGLLSDKSQLTASPPTSGTLNLRRSESSATRQKRDYFHTVDDHRLNCLPDVLRATLLPTRAISAFVT